MTVPQTDILIDAAIQTFLTIVRAGAAKIRELSRAIGRDPTEVFSDSAQANWETTAEVAVWSRDGTFLEVDGEGAD